ncbi:MAG: GH1 family beta-glucosidase [Myxococcota bacterium]
MSFPHDFVWGAATSAFQIEGATGEGGRGESIWDRFCATPGKIVDGTDGAVACDHYHRFPEDIALMKELGLNAYRFSVAWPRIQPTGTGDPNAQGLDFYARLIDGLLDAGITPYVTLYHWDLPQALQDAGGWPERSICEKFADYAAVFVGHFGDRVKHWMTFNEPWCISHLGYETGHQAPGWTDQAAALRATHHVFLSHGYAVPRIRELCPDGEVGLVLNLTPGYPASASSQDQGATDWFDGFFNRWYLDPVFGRGYPQDMLEHYSTTGGVSGTEPDFIHDGDMERIATEIDVLGVNYYSRAILRGHEEGNLPRELHDVPGDEKTDMGWEVFPEGLEALLVRLQEDYAPKTIMITENGVAYGDGPDASGRIQDTRRIEFLRGHLQACERALHRGVTLTGFFAWSLMDNFEWAHGYRMRFGLLWVDYETLERKPKDSFYWYRDAIAANGIRESL